MKDIRKLAALLLALVMVMSVAFTGCKDRSSGRDRDDDIKTADKRDKDDDDEDDEDDGDRKSKRDKDDEEDSKSKKDKDDKDDKDRDPKKDKDGDTVAVDRKNRDSEDKVAKPSDKKARKDDDTEIVEVVADADENKLEDIAPPDQVAVALLDLVVKGKPAPLRKTWGYSSDKALIAAVYNGNEMVSMADMLEEIADYYVDAMRDQIESAGASLSNSDAKALHNAFTSLIGRMDYTARVKRIDEKKGTAVVSVNVRMPDFNALDDSPAEDILAELLMDDPDLIYDPTALFSALIGAMCDKINGLDIVDAVSDDMDLVLETMDVDGKDRMCWVYEDMDDLLDELSDGLFYY